jgi:hypothetical protein
MNINPDELLGQEEDLSPVHAVKFGAHNAVATIVQYGTIAAILAVGGYLLLDEKTRKRLKERWL